MLAENQPPTDHTPTPEEVNVYFEAFATKHNQKEEMVLYINDVAQDVKDLGEPFPPPGPTPLLPSSFYLQFFNRKLFLLIKDMICFKF